MGNPKCSKGKLNIVRGRKRWGGWGGGGGGEGGKI